MRILLLTQWFDPEPTFKGLAFAKALRDAGHQVEVITGFPNYPGGNIYPGYKQRWLTRENHDGILVNRVPLFPSHDNSAIGRVLNYLTFGITSCLFGVFGIRRPDVIYCLHPPLTVGLAGVVIGFLRRTPLVYDIQDLWPDTLNATGMVNSSFPLKVVGYLCKFVYRRAAALVVLSPGFKNELKRRGVPEDKITVIYNWCDETAFGSESRPETIPSEMVGRYNIVFAGTMGRAQALDSVLAAAEIVARVNDGVQFIFVGGGIDVERLKGLAGKLRLENVVFLPRMTTTEVRPVLDAASALLVHLRDDPLFSITVPSKTQAYMAVGKPIIMAVRGDAADLVTWSGAGVLVEPENPDSLAAGVLNLASMSSVELEKMGRGASEYYLDKLSIDSGVRKFIEVFSKVCST